jgi:nitronate monooxygenase
MTDKTMPAKDLLNRLQLKYPLIVAPMAGGPSSPELVAVASRTGALGSMGAAYSSPPAIAEFVQKVRSQTDRPFAINLFAPHLPPAVSVSQLANAIQATAAYRNELGLPVPRLAPPYEENFDAQFEAMLRVRPAVFSFVFGLLPGHYLQAAQKENIVVIGTATSRDEAIALQESGVDAIALQGIEAGGHRGMFDAAAPDPEIKAFDLLQACRPAINVPLIAAGGIMDAGHVQSALRHGAQAVQMGTAFLACPEAGTSAPYKAALLKNAARTTQTTRVFSGRLARGIPNRFLREMESQPDAILPFPAQNKFTRDLRTASAAKGLPDFLSLWSGTGAGELWQGPAGKLIETLFIN